MQEEEHAAVVDDRAPGEVRAGTGAVGPRQGRRLPGDERAFSLAFSRGSRDPPRGPDEQVPHQAGRARTRRGERAGLASSIVATTPATTGAAKLVPSTCW